MKIIKISIPDKELTNPQKAFDKFSSFVVRAVKKGQEIDADSYFGTAKAMSDEFVKQNKTEILIKNVKKLSEKLTGMKSQDYAAILYGVILKVLHGTNHKLLEPIARNALAIAERNHDPVHIMARGNDLVCIYEQTEKGSKNHLKALYTTKKALNDICTNYENVKKRYKTNKTEMKPITNYRFMLATIKFQIAEILAKTNKNQAIIELEEASEILKSFNTPGKLEIKIQNLMTEINSQSWKNKMSVLW